MQNSIKLLLSIDKIIVPKINRERKKYAYLKLFALYRDSPFMLTLQFNTQTGFNFIIALL